LSFAIERDRLFVEQLDPGTFGGLREPFRSSGQATKRHARDAIAPRHAWAEGASDGPALGDASIDAFLGRSRRSRHAASSVNSRGHPEHLLMPL